MIETAGPKRLKNENDENLSTRSRTHYDTNKAKQTNNEVKYHNHHKFDNYHHNSENSKNLKGQNHLHRKKIYHIPSSIYLRSVSRKDI